MMKSTKLLFPMMLLVASGTVFAATEEGANENISFDEIDKNGDGTISREEAESASGLKDSFDSLDANADGVLDKSEVGVGGPDAGGESESDPAMNEESGSDPAMEEESGTESDY